MSDTTIEDLLTFSQERIDAETEGFEGDIPDHAARMLVAYGADLLETIANFEVQVAHGGEDDPSDEERQEAVGEDLVNVLMAVMATAHEHDIDLSDRVEEHMQFVLDYHAMHDKMQAAETREEAAEAFDEYMGERAEENPLVDAQGEMDFGGIEPGDNVDDDEYDHDREDKSYA